MNLVEDTFEKLIKESKTNSGVKSLLKWYVNGIEDKQEEQECLKQIGRVIVEKNEIIPILPDVEVGQKKVSVLQYNKNDELDLI